MMVSIGVLQDLRGHARKPAASKIGSPRCISHVAAV
jgi:hypothetical protein